MKPIALIALLAVTASIVSAQTSHPTVYLESQDEFANDFSAGVVRKNVPVTITADRENAGYVARFTWATNEGSKTQGVMTALMTGVYMSGAYERVSMSIIERKSKNLVYSYTCQKGGRHMQSVAECLAKHWKTSFESGKTQMHEYTAADLEGIRDSEADTVSVRRAGDTVPVQITLHPASADDLGTIRGAITSGSIDRSWQQSESLGDLSRRVKAEKAAQKAH
jgi:hypothetical protein